MIYNNQNYIIGFVSKMFDFFTATGEYKNGYIKDRAINGTKRKQWLEEKRKLWADI